MHTHAHTHTRTRTHTHTHTHTHTRTFIPTHIHTHTHPCRSACVKTKRRDYLNSFFFIFFSPSFSFFFFAPRKCILPNLLNVSLLLVEWHHWGYAEVLFLQMATANEYCVLIFDVLYEPRPPLAFQCSPVMGMTMTLSDQAWRFKKLERSQSRSVTLMASFWSNQSHRCARYSLCRLWRCRGSCLSLVVRNIFL